MRVQSRSRKLRRIWHSRSTGNGTLRTLCHVRVRRMLLKWALHWLLLVLLLLRHWWRLHGLSHRSIEWRIVGLAPRHIWYALPLLKLWVLHVRRQHVWKALLLILRIAAKLRARPKDLRRWH